MVELIFVVVNIILDLLIDIIKFFPEVPNGRRYRILRDKLRKCALMFLLAAFSQFRKVLQSHSAHGLPQILQLLKSFFVKLNFLSLFSLKHRKFTSKCGL
jgi:hypothetical protein